MPRRVAFISDLHANTVALDAVFADIDELGVDQIVCLGDIVDLGPAPQATVDRLRERNILSILGNHDTLDEHPPIPELIVIEDWTRAQLDAESLRWLAELPTLVMLDLDGLQVMCVHGSPRDIREQIFDVTPAADLERWSAGHEFDVWVCGHTHLQMSRRIGAQVVVNVGSVGMPFERPFMGQGAPRVLPWCEYAVVSRTAHGVSIDLRRVPLDLDAFAASLRECSFPAAESWLSHWVRP